MYQESCTLPSGVPNDGALSNGQEPRLSGAREECEQRLRCPRVLSTNEFFELLKHLCEPYRTRVLVAQCLGRISEILGMQWVTSISRSALCWFREAWWVDEWTRSRRSIQGTMFPLIYDWPKFFWHGVRSRCFSGTWIGYLPIRTREAVSPGEPAEEAHQERRQAGRSRRGDWVAYVPPHLPLLAA